MIRWHIELSEVAAKDLKRLDPPTARRIAEALRELAGELEAGRALTRPGYIEKLTGHEGHYKRRVGKYRIVFELEQREAEAEEGKRAQEGVITVLTVELRDKVYKRR